MDLHDLETPEWESYTNEGTQNRDEPITTAQNQPITAEHNASPVDEWIVDLFGRKSSFAFRRNVAIFIGSDLTWRQTITLKCDRSISLRLITHNLFLFSFF